MGSLAMVPYLTLLKAMHLDPCSGISTKQFAPKITANHKPITPKRKLGHGLHATTDQLHFEKNYLFI
jgi:hypothetical protein